MYFDVVVHWLDRRPTRRQAASLFIGVVATCLAGCSLLRWIDEHTSPGPPRPPPRVEPGPVGGREPSFLLQLSPRSIDFGAVGVGAESQRTTVVSNPSAFVVTIVKMTVEGDGFSIASHAAPLDIPAHGQVVLTVAFRPLARRDFSGVVLLEIDSAGGRFARISFKAAASGEDRSGRGVVAGRAG